MIARARLVSVLALLLAGAVQLLSSTQSWIMVTLADGAAEELAVSGADAVALLAPLSLTLLALGAALSIVGRITGVVFGVLGLAIGVGLSILTAVVVFATPTGSVAGAVSAVTGLSGDDAVAQLVASLRLTPWPVISLLAAITVVAASVFTIVTAARWPDSGRRYRQTRTPRTGGDNDRLDPVDSWDDLSRGEDPTHRTLD